ncbi:hypothetical protein VTN77DRAFT_4146 [Rasamsonia byssochlamydoides]|uniref:uncharacterized protein n=1 Tax=Rasamsonia byssochlamydoides TaxID=89139 RepID=UPI003743173A
MPPSTNGQSSSSSIPLASLLVARFLRSNNYAATLDTFIREAGLPPDAGGTRTDTTTGDRSSAEYDDWTLEGVIQEKKTFDQSLRFERYGDDDGSARREGWSVPAPSKPTIVDTPSSSNLLSVSVEPWQQQQDDIETVDNKKYLVATAADKTLNLFDVGPSNRVVASLSGLSDSPILSYVSIRGGRYHLATSMSGQLLLIKNAEVLDWRKDHSKYAVKVVAYENEDADEEGRVWIVTAGWDAKVLIYRMTLSSSSPTIGEPVSTIKLPTNPESILIVRNPESRELTLLVSRRDSTYLYYYALEPLRARTATTTTADGESQRQPRECVLRGKQNLAPHSNAWIAFSPSCMALSPHDPGLLAVALSTLPHMKVMIVRLLFPSSDSVENTTTTATAATAAATAEPSSETHLSQAMAALALQNREDAAIVIQANTFAPQTAYSTPQVVWRPDGSGLWVNGDDGVIRGIEAKTGKVVAMLKEGHEAGSKVRSIWAGLVSSEEDDKKEEWVVSGGFDKRLVVWKV